MTALRFAHRAAAAAFSVLLLMAAPQPLHAQQSQPTTSDAEPTWVFSPGVGIITLLRLEAARETTGPSAYGFALGLHPLGIPSVEALIRRQIGQPSANGATTFVDVAALGFVPGTQFTDGAYPGVGLHLTLGRRWLRTEHRKIQLRLGVAVYQEISGKADKDGAVIPMRGLDFGRQRSRGRP